MKHLITQERVAEAQFREAQDADVQLSRMPFQESYEPHPLAFASFLVDLGLLHLSSRRANALKPKDADLSHPSPHNGEVCCLTGVE
ncbi:hypothetical protein GGD67_002782 [Bradyrhizobium sp. IAR9]|uniref:hypothetical protein n=1 Tax=Bradyrhizobium sp. IAR9 TaxID=2663841 RepID=UPI0015CD1564|nr:hypothetical protein [Bradyrhizobium sp. IAR9]NYG45324.1 hypothetical protein [Bradyrhizobium sp. IAR9]